MEDTRRYQYNEASPDYEPPPECLICNKELKPNTGCYCPECTAENT